MRILKKFSLPKNKTGFDGVVMAVEKQSNTDVIFIENLTPTLCKSFMLWFDSRGIKLCEPYGIHGGNQEFKFDDIRDKTDWFS